MTKWLRRTFRGRPLWINALMVFSAYMAFVYVPWDVFLKPVAEDAEVWFGVLFHGWGAKLLAIPHLAVYAWGAYGFYHMRPWMFPWASLYVGQIAIGMFVWMALYTDAGFGGLVASLVASGLFGALAVALWRARPLFEAPRPPLRERYGEWALVTGASAGIGAEFARALAREGMSVVLSARREERLRELAAEIEKAHGVSTRVVAADLSDPDAAERLVGAVADLEIAVLVNNAGAGYAGRFSRLETGRLRDMVELNCVAPVVLTSHLLPAMRDRGRGAVIVTGSVAGRQPLPLHGVYSATKAFDLLFGEALAVECEDEGVDVLVVEPGRTATEFQAVAGEAPPPDVSFQPAHEVVEVALLHLGRRPSVVSGWMNWLRANAAQRLIPRSLAAHIAEGVIAKQTPAELR
jgi:short-subunit dehydrogenase